MRKVLILLSTYNGEKYLREQLDSLYGQKDVDIHILVRDDGSKDSTLTILNEYCARYNRMTIVADSNIGAAKSFYQLIGYANKVINDFNYYAFSDQDDVWFPNKLATAVKTLDESEGNMKLFCGSAISTDAQLNPIPTVKLRGADCLGANIVSSRVLGCTMVFDRTLLFQISRILPFLNNGSLDNFKVPLHDSWTSLVLFAFNGMMLSSSEPLMYYRQHGHNVVGTEKDVWRLTKTRIHRYIKDGQIKSQRCRIAMLVFENDLPTENKDLLEKCANYRLSLSKRLSLIFCKSIYHYGFVDAMGTIGMILLGRF